MIRYLRARLLDDLPAHAQFCAPSRDIPLHVYGMKDVPTLVNLSSLDPRRPVVVLEGQRMPDEWVLALTAKGCDTWVFGDPDALLGFGPRFERQDAVRGLMEAADPAPPLVIQTYMATSVEDAWNQRKGYTRVLASSNDNRDMAYEKMRPSGHEVGDMVWDNESRQLACITQVRAQFVMLDTGHRRRPSGIVQRVVETYASWGSGTCDTVIILPDVPDKVGYRCCRRVRYMVIAVGMSPQTYLIKTQC